jgi:hypothetical protein
MPHLGILVEDSAAAMRPISDPCGSFVHIVVQPSLCWRNGWVVLPSGLTVEWGYHLSLLFSQLFPCRIAYFLVRCRCHPNHRCYEDRHLLDPKVRVNLYPDRSLLSRKSRHSLLCVGENFCCNVSQYLYCFLYSVSPHRVGLRIGMFTEDSAIPIPSSKFTSPMKPHYGERDLT